MSDPGRTEAASAGELFRLGQLTRAIEAAGAAVRKSPTDAAARFRLAEFLLFAGNYERADVVLDAAGQIDPGSGLSVAEFRQLLRAETARRQWWREGRVPDFLDEPTESQRHLLAAAVAARDGDEARAASLAMDAEAARPRAPGRAGESLFDDARDADDLCGGTLEVLTTTGKYFWIPIERFVDIVFHPPQRPRDLFWRRASVTVRAGPQGDVYIPAIYDAAGADDSLRLGHATDWVGGEHGLTRGVGQRVFLIGEAAPDILSLRTLEFGAAVS